MIFDIMTLFPDLVRSVLSESIIGRAQNKGIIKINIHNIRDYSEDKHHRVDDTPYGGGKGMLMAAPPIVNCFNSIEKINDKSKIRTVYMSPQGKILNQTVSERISKYEQIIILCGHYEGIDERVIESIIDEEISIGNYILTGGELPACIFVDSVARLVEGVLSDAECHEIESLSGNLLEFPQYTRPYDFNGMYVPDVLLSGNHKEIDEWRHKMSYENTLKKRPDLLVDYESNKKQ